MLSFYIILKVVFGSTSFSKLLNRIDKNDLHKHLKAAIEKENYRLAAYLKYYLEFYKNE